MPPSRWARSFGWGHVWDGRTRRRTARLPPWCRTISSRLRASGSAGSGLDVSGSESLTSTSLARLHGAPSPATSIVIGAPSSGSTRTRAQLGRELEVHEVAAIPDAEVEASPARRGSPGSTAARRRGSRSRCSSAGRGRRCRPSRRGGSPPSWCRPACRRCRCATASTKSCHDCPRSRRAWIHACTTRLSVEPCTVRGS